MKQQNRIALKKIWRDVYKRQNIKRIGLYVSKMNQLIQKGKKGDVKNG